MEPGAHGAHRHRENLRGLFVAHLFKGAQNQGFA
jgi:hypothetical protein